MRTTITIDDDAATVEESDRMTAPRPVADAVPAAESAGAYDAPQTASPGPGTGTAGTGAGGGAIDAGVVDPELVELIETARAAGLNGEFSQADYDVDDLEDIVDAGEGPG